MTGWGGTAARRASWPKSIQYMLRGEQQLTLFLGAVVTSCVFVFHSTRHLFLVILLSVFFFFYFDFRFLFPSFGRRPNVAVRDVNIGNSPLAFGGSQAERTGDETAVYYKKLC